MRIKLEEHYSGLPSNFRPIFPGEYDAEDERIFGLATYLVKTGHATEIEDLQPTEDEPNTGDGEPVDDEADLDSMTKAQLEAFATESQIDVSKAKTKDAMIDAIHKASEANDAWVEAAAEEEEEDGDSQV